MYSCGVRVTPVLMNSKIPPPEHACWLHLIESQAAGFKTHDLALGLLMQRLHAENLPPLEKARQVHAYFRRYERLLAVEIDQLARYEICRS